MSHQNWDTDEEIETEELTQKENECNDSSLILCSYCGISDHQALVQCYSTNKWFCNGKGIASGSHIIYHLIKSKNSSCRLHPESPLGDIVLECYQCGCRNIFLLGFITLKNDNVVVLLCRDPCLSSGSNIKELDWDISQWQPIIEEKAFLPWLVAVPSERDQLKAKQIKSKQINLLEKYWTKFPDATLEDIESGKIDSSSFENINNDLIGDLQDLDQKKFDQIPEVFTDGYQYQNILAPMVGHLAETDRALKMNLKQGSIIVKWEKSLKNSFLAVFHFPLRDDSSFRINNGDELKIFLSEESSNEHKLSWEGIGRAIRVNESEITLELNNNYSHYRKYGPPPIHINNSYVVEFLWNSISYDRMQAALRTFAVQDTSVSGYIYHRLLGHEVENQILKVNLPLDYSVPGLPPLNPSQLLALKSVLQKPLSLIQGPPGTGKTVTSASIIYHLAQQKIGQVLVCAPSNVAVDHLAEKISMTGLKVVRIFGKSRESIGSNVDFLALHNLVRDLRTPQTIELQKLFLLKEEIGELSLQDTKNFKSLITAAENIILSAADVICTTCIGAGDSRIQDRKFRQLLIDECTQAMEPECLIPIVKGIKQLIVVGDHCQLGPVVISKPVGSAGLSRSLFERLIMLDCRPIRLKVQYRMHPTLSEFPSNVFYEGALQNGISERERQISTSFHWPNPSIPLFFWNNNGIEELGSTGLSFLNRVEAGNVEKIVTMMIKSGITSEQIGIITPYEGQRSFITNFLLRNSTLKSDLYKDIEVASVDAFQGREKDYIIVSCVRSNTSQGIGFLKDPRRLNVALTRAKYGVIIIGNTRLLAKDPLWYRLIEHFQTRECVFDGPINNLSLMTFPFPKPTNYNKAIEVTPYVSSSFFKNNNKEKEKNNDENEIYYNRSKNNSSDYDLRSQSSTIISKKKNSVEYKDSLIERMMNTHINNDTSSVNSSQGKFHTSALYSTSSLINNLTDNNYDTESLYSKNY